MNEKDYKEWGKVKARINNCGKPPEGFRARQIWWCSIGENVGIETDGKHEQWLRPVLIIKRFNTRAFFAVPLTSRHKTGQDSRHFVRLEMAKKDSWAMLSQARTWDACRLVSQMGKVDYESFGEIKKRLGEYLGLG